MAVIENFAALSPAEQREFAEALIKTINSEHIFSDDADFKIYEVDAEDLDGSLVISVENTDYVNVKREATWATSADLGPDDDAATTFPSSDHDVDYADSIYADFKRSLKTLSAEIEGYTVSVYDVMEVDEGAVEEVEVDEVTQEDDGIGSYEYWGRIEYDSRPYLEVSGTVTKQCDVAFALEILPSDKAEA